MVDHRSRDEPARRRRGRSPTNDDEQDEQRALLDLQHDAGNRAVSGAIESLQGADREIPGDTRADSPGLRVLDALRAARVPVQRQAAGGLLRRGMRGPQVAALQEDLSRAGFGVASDGIFGPATLAAVIAFQRGAGLVADGLVGPLTRGALASGGKAAGKGSVEKEAWAPGTDEVAEEKAEKEAAAKASTAKEAWAPGTDEVAEEKAEKAAAKESSEKAVGTDKEDWWPT